MDEVITMRGMRIVVGEIEAGQLKAVWDEAALIPSGAGWATALNALETGRDFAAHKRHSVYNIQRLYLDFLQALDMREDSCRATLRAAKSPSTSSARSAR